MKRRLEILWNHRSPQFALGQPFAKLALRSDLHLARKAWHMLMGLFMVSIYLSGMERTLAVTTLATFLAWDLVMEFSRLRFPMLNDQIMRVWGPVMRASEANRMSGIPYYIASCMLAVAIFPKTVAILSILFLACGDPMASLVGILYGKNGPRFKDGKSYIGTAAGVATCGVVGFFFMLSAGITGLPLLALSVIGALAGGLVEMIPWDLDDNLTIPIVSGFVMWLAFIVVGF